MSENQKYAQKTERYRARVSDGGRVVIPAALRRALKIETGDRLILYVKDGELRLYTRNMAIERAQELVRKYVPEDVSLVDELIADRRREVAREKAEAAKRRLPRQPI